MNWNDRFSERTAHMSRTAVRELLKLTAQPGMISFAGGLPAPELFPLNRFRQATHDVLERVGPRALQYGETEGLAELRDWIARRFSSGHTQVRRENVLIVSGAQQGLDLVGRVFLDPGDSVVVENPTYLALLSAWRPLGASFLPVNSDADGLCVEDLERVLEQHPKLIYAVPTFQNPQGTTLSLERRHQVTALLADSGTVLIEDNPYGDLRYDGDSLPNLHALDLAAQGHADQGKVIYVGTVSKVLMPGLRVGWVIAPEPVIEKLVRAKQAADLHTSTFNQHIILELVKDGYMDRHVDVLRAAYRQRRDAMLAALETHMPDAARWTRPEGGMFLLLTLPDGLDAQALLKRALEQKVAFVPGEEFHLNSAGAPTIRLNFSSVPPQLIEEGIKRLGKLVSDSRSRSVACESTGLVSRHQAEVSSWG